MIKNSHHFFIALSTLSILFTALALFTQGRSKEIESMLLIFLPVLTGLLLLLFITRKRVA